MRLFGLAQTVQQKYSKTNARVDGNSVFFDIFS